jgi:hypothetical protein
MPYHIIKASRQYQGVPYCGPTSDHRPAVFDSLEDAELAQARFQTINPVGWTIHEAPKLSDADFETALTKVIEYGLNYGPEVESKMIQDAVCPESAEKAAQRIALLIRTRHPSIRLHKGGESRHVFLCDIDGYFAQGWRYTPPKALEIAVSDNPEWNPQTYAKDAGIAGRWDG